MPGRPVSVSVEVPRGSFVKRDDRGRVEYLSPVPCPFAYGSVVGRAAADGDNADALVLDATGPHGSVLHTTAWSVVRFSDAGVPDDKLVCAMREPSPTALRLVALFFRVYAQPRHVMNRLRGRTAPTQFRGIEPL
jgi:inorganic pyrophosphatase